MLCVICMSGCGMYKNECICEYICVLYVCDMYECVSYIRVSVYASVYLFVLYVCDIYECVWHV